MDRFERWMHEQHEQLLGASSNRSMSAARVFWEHCVLGDEDLLYQQAVRLFEQQIARTGPGLVEEEAQFASMQAVLTARCVGADLHEPPNTTSDNCRIYNEDNVPWNERHGGGCVPGCGTTHCLRRCARRCRPRARR